MSIFDVFLDFLLNPWFLLSALFWGIILILIYALRKHRENFVVFFPFLVLLKTKKLNNFITRISKKNPKFWKIFWTIGIFISFSFMIFAFYFFFINLINLILNPKIENAVTPLIPGVTISLPIFMYLIIPILFVMTTHEFAHGIAASIDHVEIKSTGVLGAGIFYLIGLGAFVEVNERALNSSKYHRNTRLRIASAGTFVNAITAGIAFLLLLSFSYLISPFYGAQVNQVAQVLTEEQGGFNEGKLEKGDVIRAVKEKDSHEDFLYLDQYHTLNDILENNTRRVKCSAGEKLTLKIYRPNTGKTVEKDILLGPLYNIGILYEYPSNTELKITRILTKEEGGNNYKTKLKENVIITKINGTHINVDKGKTLEKELTNYNLTELKLTSESGESYKLDVDLDGVRIGILTSLYWMPTTDLAKFFGGNFPDFLLRELIWLWIIAFSVTLFNMLPLPIFDGDRVVKELVRWGFGEEYTQTKKKKERIFYKKNEKNYDLSEYRVKKIDTVKIILANKNNKKLNLTSQSEILLNESRYTLIDNIGDGFQSTISLDIADQTKLQDNSVIEVEYEFWYDQKKPRKKLVLNCIRLIALFIVIGNFILSYVRLGAVTFWI